MIRYMAEMYKDAANSTWGSVEDVHAAVLHDMETGDLAWEDEELIRAKSLKMLQRQPQGKEARYCGYCFEMTGNTFFHTEDKCQKRMKATRADKGYKTEKN